MSMYTLTPNPIHCNNDLNNDNTWSIQRRSYPQAQQKQYTQCQINMTSNTNNNNNAMDSPNKLKHKEVMLYKTESCRNWTELGHCRYGKKCRYAHGSDELRTVPRHNRYKTQICRAYHMDGSCPYGIRCTFVHGSDVQYQQQDIKKSGDHYVELPFNTSQPPPPSSIKIPPMNLDVGTNNRTTHHDPFECIRRKSSVGSHDDDLSSSGSSSGDESLIGNSLIDFDCNYYRHQNAKDLMMKRQESIETMYHIHHHNNFNNNNRAIIWM